MSTLKKCRAALRRDDAASQAAGGGAMLVAWARRTTHNTSASAQASAPIACTQGESNPIAAQNFICASYQR
jgi:hypothetical protein